jgi:hypothetical protein
MRQLVALIAAVTAAGVVCSNPQESALISVASMAPQIDLEGAWVLRWEDHGRPRASQISIHRHDGLVCIDELHREFSEENPNQPGSTLRDPDGEWVFLVHPLNAKSFALTESSSGKRWVVRLLER